MGLQPWGFALSGGLGSLLNHLTDPSKLHPSPAGPQLSSILLDQRHTWTIYLFFSEHNLRRALSTHVTYYNWWRPHRSLGKRAPCGAAMSLPQDAGRSLRNLYSGGHHIYGFTD